MSVAPRLDVRGMLCRDERVKEDLLELALRTGPSSAGCLAVVKLILEDDVAPHVLSQRQKDTPEVTAAALRGAELPVFRVQSVTSHMQLWPVCRSLMLLS